MTKELGMYTYSFSLWARGGSAGRESACNARNVDFSPSLGRSPGEGNSYPLQCSCLENSMDRGAWQTTVHGVAKSWTQVNDQHFHFHILGPWETVDSVFEMMVISDGLSLQRFGAWREFLARDGFVPRVWLLSLWVMCDSLWPHGLHSMPGSPVLNYLPEFAQIHGNWVGDAF